MLRRTGLRFHTSRCMRALRPRAAGAMPLLHATIGTVLNHGSSQQRGKTTLSDLIQESSWRTMGLIVGLAFITSGAGYVGYVTFFGASTIYPKEERKLLREAGMAYCCAPENQDLPKAIECYTKALSNLDKLGEEDPTHARNAFHITGLVARIAEVYTEMGNLDKAIEMYMDFLQRILDEGTMNDPKQLVGELLDKDLTTNRQHNIRLTLGCANKLAEVYEMRSARSKRRIAVLPSAAKSSSADTEAANRWYQWCLQLVTLTYLKDYNASLVEQGKPTVREPPFDPDTLPKCFSTEEVASLFYNAATFFTRNGQPYLGAPLLMRALDLLRHGADGKEENVCRSSIILSHLANAAVESGNLSAAEKWAIEGLRLAKKFRENADCLSSFVALAYDLGVVYEAAGMQDSARVQYRHANVVARAAGDSEAERLTTAALDRISAASLSDSKK
ncbi:hypothetical protein COEREDRAFT_82541 [Coemansia reversa NRRL 1564]|uniref:TPR-like protein n=1 Tax=Coemansia reversa (strain ATCC 12441 / NRRL 1564) TaxID=763665 RepID=A0A2G5B7F2_COERN|nr:hypothetical protein COEREDRAFT_82541 [Coemansia reversa NRRL 1564]|eukprot:PIA14657.1 hypothetical protein COEREDRAFT_82541 [Coemansia reversa NRRL 1564]